MKKLVDRLILTPPDAFLARALKPGRNFGALNETAMESSEISYIEIIDFYRSYHYIAETILPWKISTHRMYKTIFRYKNKNAMAVTFKFAQQSCLLESKQNDSVGNGNCYEFFFLRDFLREKKVLTKKINWKIATISRSQQFHATLNRGNITAAKEKMNKK